MVLSSVMTRAFGCARSQGPASRAPAEYGRPSFRAVWSVTAAATQMPAMATLTATGGTRCGRLPNIAASGAPRAGRVQSKRKKPGRNGENDDGQKQYPA